MRNLILKESKKIFTNPSVTLNAQTGKCDVIGESFIENASEFYQPVFDWLNAYTEKIKGEMVWSFRMEYFNSSSAKVITNLLKTLKRYEQNGGKVTVNWHYPSYNMTMLEDGECLSDVSRLKFNFVLYQASPPPRRTRVQIKK
ncbi:DUF1987 domain-containing protein [uncultured Microscilla sp.]|uniref:DUF1987 domain-containing protein n=1 Tax=uncultured Microscilla sp. TaxID=432653 RepID=UPI00260D9E75|nr:DUF1987 domain-containing protein [uncultured Microscilla sp.]